MICLQVVKLHHDLEEQVHHNSQLMADNGARQVGATLSWTPLHDYQVQRRAFKAKGALGPMCPVCD
jgi:hypothetical protein